MINTEFYGLIAAYAAITAALIAAIVIYVKYLGDNSNEN